MRRAFTLIELCMGLVVTSLVMGAAAVFMSATASVWNASEDAQGNVQTSNQVQRRLLSVLRESAALGAVETGAGANPAAALIWRGDANEDGQVQTSETAVLVHDTATRSLVLELPLESSSATWTPEAFRLPATINTIRASISRSHAIMRRVTTVNFAVIRPTDAIRRAILEYDVTTTNGKTVDRYYGTVALRTPREPE